MKLLHVSLGNQVGQQRALMEVFGQDNYLVLDWTKNPREVDAWLTEVCGRFWPDVVFMQLQCDNLVREETLHALRRLEIKIVNFNCDVRDETPFWMKALGYHCDLTLVTNHRDERVLRQLGINAAFQEIGYDDMIYTPGAGHDHGKVVFVGSNYEIFPLSELRKEMVRRLTEEFGGDFRYYGHGWGDDVPALPEAAEVDAYRNCEVAINLSHYDFYTGDRLYRATGCGALTLSYGGPGVDKQYNPPDCRSCYGTIWDRLDYLVESIRFWRANPELCREVALKQHYHTKSNHTWTVFAHQLRAYFERL